MASWQTFSLKTAGPYVSFAGIRMSRIFSPELFLKQAAVRLASGSKDLARHCHDRWTDLAGTVAALPHSTEFYLVLASGRADKDSPPIFETAFLTVARNRVKSRAVAECSEAADNLAKLLPAFLDYAEFEPITRPEMLENLIGYLGGQELTEIRRRLERIRIGQGTITREPAIGFLLEPPKPTEDQEPQITQLEILHLFPWVPSDDPWWRLVDILAAEPGPAALVVQVRGWQKTPPHCLEQAQAILAGIEEAGEQITDLADLMQVQGLKAGALREEMLMRLSALEGPAVSARVFLSTHGSPSGALLSVVESSVDDPSVEIGQPGAGLLFRGGAHFEPSHPAELLSSLEDPSLELLFSPREAAAVLRTPMPTDNEIPGLALNRARTAQMLGPGGEDCTLGLNVHRGTRRPVRLDRAERLRHCFVTGQRGTGKSTFLLHQVLHDLEQGRGVAVLDPDGSLVENILLRFPKKRAGDLILVDVNDTAHPVGFNPLLLRESDPVRYRTDRDALIEDFCRHVHPEAGRTGGPAGRPPGHLVTRAGPALTTHLRAMLGLLLGTRARRAPLAPSLLILNLLYSHPEQREKLARRIAGKDPWLDETIEKAMGIEAALRLPWLASHATDGLVPFIQDVTLRNLTCQNRTVDLKEVVAKGKVVLFVLGAGKIGEHAAGLLASLFFSRLQQMILNRGGRGSGEPFCLHVDGLQLLANHHFAGRLPELGKAGLAITMTQQNSPRISPTVLRSILGNIGTTVQFRIAARDCEFFEPIFAPTFGRRDLVSLPDHRAYVRGLGSLGNGPFNVDVPPPEEVVNAGFARALRLKVRKRYGRPRTKVQKEIAGTLEAFTAKRSKK